jgi:hypothetical protein
LTLPRPAPWAAPVLSRPLGRLRFRTPAPVALSAARAASAAEATAKLVCTFALASQNVQVTAPSHSINQNREPTQERTQAWGRSGGFDRGGKDLRL